MVKSILKKYANLLINKGVALKKGQVLYLTIKVPGLFEYYEFYREIYKERLIKYGECHHLTKDGYNIILAFNELFCLELESLGYKIDHILEKWEHWAALSLFKWNFNNIHI